VVIVILLGIIGFISAFAAESVPLFFGFFIPALFFAVALISKAQSNAKKNREIVQPQIAEWHATWFCHRCGNTFGER
jgi:hypothetical protein